MNTAILIPVRLNSSRLPKKALLDLAGAPVIEHLVNRSKLATLADMIVICATELASDDPLVEVAERLAVKLFRGSENDIVDRLLRALEQYQADNAIVCEADDLLIDPEQIDGLARVLAEGNDDYVYYEGLPFGATPRGLTLQALRTVCKLKEQTDTSTGWGALFTDSGRFKVRILTVDDPDLLHPEMRLTLDYPEDYQLFKAIFIELHRPGRPVRLREALRLLSSRPDIASLNAGVEEKYWANLRSASKPRLGWPVDKPMAAAPGAGKQQGGTAGG